MTPVPAQVAVPRDIGLVEWLFDADTWTGPSGILASAWDTITPVSYTHLRAHET